MKPKGDTAWKEHPALSRPVLVHGVMAGMSVPGKKFQYNQPTLAYLADNGYV
jgi:hypothetical protein